MRFCKDCEFYLKEIITVNGLDKDFCSWAFNIEGISLVTGEKISKTYNAFHKCELQRNHANLCGQRGAWFQPKSK